MAIVSSSTFTNSSARVSLYRSSQAPGYSATPSTLGPLGNTIGAREFGIDVRGVVASRGNQRYSALNISRTPNSLNIYNNPASSPFFDRRSANLPGSSSFFETTIVKPSLRASVSTGTNDFSGPTSATKGEVGQLPAQDQTTSVNSATGGTPGSPASGTRELTCPNCGGQILSKTGGRLMFYINMWLQRFPDIAVAIGVILNYLKERAPISKTVALNVCGACQNKRTLKDPSDDSAKYAQSASIAQGLAPAIEQEEAKLQPPGGNRYTVIAGHDLLEVGLGINDAPSYRVDRDCAIRNWGLATSTKSSTTGSGFQTGEANSRYSYISSKGAKANHVQGLNPPASPGGHYIIKCSNKFSVVTGCQGIDITTGGPVTIDGGITRITGPEVTIGTQTGRLLLEGETINMGAKSIEMAPSDGHVYTRGTMSCSGNLIVGGHSHLESASVVKLATVGKNDNSKIAASSNVYGGPAFWGGPIYEGIYAALRELLAFVTVNTLHPVHLKEVGPLSFRFPQTLIDNALNIAYVLRPIEFLPTGICIVAYGSSTGIHFIWNFPHIHAMPDQPHTHGMRVPDIDYDSETSQQLRGIHAAGADGPAPLHKKSTSLIDVIVAIWSVINAAWVAAGKAILEWNYVK